MGGQDRFVDGVSHSVPLVGGGHGQGFVLEIGVVLAFEGHCKLLDEVWLEGLAGVNARVPLLYRVVGPLWCQRGLAVGSGLCYSLHCGVCVCGGCFWWLLA